MAENQQPTLDEAIEKMRTEIIIAHSKSQQSALNGFDVLVNQLKNYHQTAIELRKEIQRLQELCDKNNITYKEKNKEATFPETKNKK